MGASHSWEDMEICESDEEYEEDEDDEDEDEDDESEDSRDDTPHKYPSWNCVHLFRYINGNSPNAKWVTAEKLAACSFVKTSKIGGEDDDGDDDGDDDDDDDDDDDGDGDDDDEEKEEDVEKGCWVLKVGLNIREKVSEEMKLKAYKDQCRVDFIAKAVWALKFRSHEDYTAFVSRFNDCLLENNHGVELSQRLHYIWDKETFEQ